MVRAFCSRYFPSCLRNTPSNFDTNEIPRGQKINANFFVQSFSTTLRVMDVRAENRGRPHQKVRFSAAPVAGRNFLTPGHPGVRVGNVRAKSGPKSLCLCCFLFIEYLFRMLRDEKCDKRSFHKEQGSCFQACALFPCLELKTGSQRLRETSTLNTSSGTAFPNVRKLGGNESRSSKRGPGSQRFPRILRNLGVLQEGSSECFKRKVLQNLKSQAQPFRPCKFFSQKSLSIKMTSLQQD